MMNLYSLKKNKEHPNIERAFGDNWDICEGFVICAESAAQARQFAFENREGCENKSVWLDPQFSIAIQIGTASQFLETGIILTDFKAG